MEKTQTYRVRNGMKIMTLKQKNYFKKILKEATLKTYVQINLKTEFKLINKGKSLLPKLIPFEMKTSFKHINFCRRNLKSYYETTLQ